ncbi:MAG: Crp/Fnr family transcriptional regulator, partial [bacterium]
MASELSHDEAARLLQDIFPGLEAEDIKDLASLGELRTYAVDCILCREGEYEDVFYVIYDGKVEVTKMLDDEQVHVLNKMGAREFFGEMALIHDAPRGATIRTLEPTTVLEINRAVFDKVLYRSPAMAVTVMREIAERLRQ